MSLASLFEEHFEATPRVRIEIPEIESNGKALVLYAEPLTYKDRVKLRKMPTKDETEFEVELIILKAQLENGTKAFGREDKQILMSKTDWRIITRIADAITGASLGQVEKNSGTIPSE